MSNRTYEDYIKNDCHPVGYNEPCQSYYFAQSSVDLLLNKIDLLKQQLAEKDKEIAHLKEKDNYHLRYELAGADETIINLKQQLAEKDIRIEELEGQFAYECECNKQLVELQKQLEEKQKTIDEINKEFVQAVHDWKALCAEKDKEIENCKRNELYEENMKILAVKNQKQLAIQELEKTKDLLLNESKNNPIIYDVNDDLVGGAIDKDAVFKIIDQQIKELKGE